MKDLAIIFLIHVICIGLLVWRGWRFRIAIIPVAVFYVTIFGLGFYGKNGGFSYETFEILIAWLLGISSLVLLVMLIIGRKKQKVQKPIVDQVK